MFFDVPDLRRGGRSWPYRPEGAGDWVVRVQKDEWEPYSPGRLLLRLSAVDPMMRRKPMSTPPGASSNSEKTTAAPPRAARAGTARAVKRLRREDLTEVSLEEVVGLQSPLKEGELCDDMMKDFIS